MIVFLKMQLVIGFFGEIGREETGEFPGIIGGIR